MFMKTREHLPCKEQQYVDREGNVHTRRTIKPRMLANLALPVHSQTAQVAKAVTRRLKETFDGTPIPFVCTISGEKVHTTIQTFWCAGVENSKGADRAFHAMSRSDGIVLAVCGDDNAVSLGLIVKALRRLAGLKRLPYSEGDFSMLDSTLDGPICIREFATWALPLGVTPFEIDVLTAPQAAPYSARVGNVVIRGDSEEQFTTGSTLTSTHQTMITILAYHKMLSTPDRDFTDTAAELGLVLKTQDHASLHTVQFLHMTYVPVTIAGVETHCMCPLPGAVVKWGKVSSDPVIISRIPGEPRPSIEEATRRVAAGVAISHPEIPSNFPVLGPFLERMGQLSNGADVAVSRDRIIDDYAYKPRVSKFSLSEKQRNQILNLHAERYECTVEDLLEVEALIRSVTSIPSYIQHPLFVKMAATDY
jgi:hypothetical protein